MEAHLFDGWDTDIESRRKCLETSSTLEFGFSVGLLRSR
jgi:hypothetical protein